MQEKSIDRIEARFIKGVGPTRFKGLRRLGINSVQDLLYFFPRCYEDRSKFTPIGNLRPGNTEMIKGEISDCRLIRTRRGLNITEIKVNDDSGLVSCVWFNQSYLKNVFRIKDKVVLYGKVDMFRGLKMNSPEFEIIRDEKKDSLNVGRIVPVYSLTEKLSQRVLRSVIYEALRTYANSLSEFLPYDIRNRNNLPNIVEAVNQIHFPEDFGKYSLARRRFVFEELFLLQLGIGIKRLQQKTSKKGVSHSVSPELFKDFLKKLPFQLTESQKKVIREIEEDMIKPQPMNRLLQGDVGSGKTVVAAYALLVTANNGFQGALMVPTEILAEQHFLNLGKLFLQFNMNIGFLISGISKEEKERVREDLRNGEIDIIVGTHSLLEEDIVFKNLGLVVIDEQHKFGVMQRKNLIEKGLNPDVLIMTATPIPRTLALTIYGDLDISSLSELPKGRGGIKTFWVSESKREAVYSFIKKELEEGHQAFIVYPLIEDSESLDLKSATCMYEKIRNGVFQEFKVGLIHGRLLTREKDKIMEEFRSRKLNILVSTLVIEVGIDISDVTVIMIENAERFGLAQLHQLRGRVGRGKSQSYCILMSSGETDEAKQRLNALVETGDGFEIAEKDLKIRGPGEFFGELQHGLPEIKIADIINDIKTLERARQEAFDILKRDPGLCEKNHRGLLKKLKEKFVKFELLSIG